MEQKDKFGNRLSDAVYAIMVNYGLILKNCGYKESKNKPNLFYKTMQDIVYFADMRGTDIVKLWDDQRPMFYANEKEKMPDWKKRRLIKQECNSLQKAGCPTRFSFYQDSEPDGIMFDNEEDGFCKECGKDFQNSGYYCSEACIETVKRRMLAKYINNSPFCEICKKKTINPNSFEEIEKEFGVELATQSVGHHISYKDDITIIVCASCHAKIHHSRDPAYAQYRPESARPKKKTSNIYGICIKCGGKALIKKTEECICYRCKKFSPCKYCGTPTQSDYNVCKSCNKQWRLKKEKKLRLRGWDLK